MSAALGLYRLQLIDSRMDEIHARLDEIRQVLENNVELHQANKQVSETDANLQLARHKLKQAETEVDKQKIKIEQSEANLYSGNVKNPKELQDLQNEVAALKRHLETLEDRQLEFMLEEETKEQAHQAALDKLERVKARVAEQNQTLTAEQSELNKNLERLDAERSAALSPLDPSLLTVYDGLRQQKRGLAIAAVNDDACAACGTTLTPAQLQSARSTTQLNNCPTCGRILYAN
jgi:predicted  nucleic acid-binding Zn-ribbon protein